jgi:hypothetical protein
MGEILGLIGLIVFVVAVISLAASVTWLVVRLFPSNDQKKQKARAQES